ncbi:MAG: VWA domain-containing protein [Pyrinomonadaceae bacterium]|nr:VWA domain-containing protein [Pyrinomonadaceae bacterium]
MLLAACACVGVGQSFERELNASARGEIVVKNYSGRVTIVAAPIDEERRTISLRAEAPGGGAATVGEQDVIAKASDNTTEIEVPSPGGEGRGGRRIDLILRVPARSKVRVATGAGAVDVSGALREVSVSTDTGTIRVDVPTNALKYSFRWTASRPRFVSELELGEVKERRGGRFEIVGRLGDKEAGREDRVRLDLETARGVVLFGVDPATIPSDLRERKLTDAARAIIRSGNEDLIEAIRTIAPKFVGEYAVTLPPRRAAPSLAAFQRPASPATAAASGAQLIRVNASVTDLNGRAIKGLTAADFDVYENGEQRPVGEVSPANTPFNLVLLLDVSGSVEERLDFVRKAALDFLRTVSPQDRIAILSFRDDVQLISDFTTDRQQLAERVKDIEAGGGTAVYDALAYTLVHTLSPLRGERTAVVLISDGDDNRSFVSFAAVLEATIESGALVYPLYLPSGLVPAGNAPALATGDAAQSLDPTRTRYLSLTSRAAVEGRKLAETSGGVFYPITRFDELQRAYDDVVAQLRTAYTISYTSNAPGTAAERRVRVRLARRQDAAIRLSPVVGATVTTVP